MYIFGKDWDIYQWTFVLSLHFCVIRLSKHAVNYSFIMWTELFSFKKNWREWSCPWTGVINNPVVEFLLYTASYYIILLIFEDFNSSCLLICIYLHIEFFIVLSAYIYWRKLYIEFLMSCLKRLWIQIFSYILKFPYGVEWKIAINYNDTPQIAYVSCIFFNILFWYKLHVYSYIFEPVWNEMKVFKWFFK